MLAFLTLMVFPSGDYSFYKQRIYSRHSLFSHPVLFIKHFDHNAKKEGIYSKCSMLSFLLFMAVTKADFYISTKYIYQTLYDRSSCVLYK